MTAPSKNTEILASCPFCAGDANLVIGIPPWNDISYAECPACSISTINFATAAEAISAWNKRPAAAGPEGAVENLEFVIARLEQIADPATSAAVTADMALEALVCARAITTVAPKPCIEKESGQVYGIIDPDYGRVYTMVRKLAWEEGYAIGLHGSFTRDLDLIAVPWEAPSNCNPEKLVARILQATGLTEARPGSKGNPGEKPYGRLVWTLMLPDFGDPRFVDLSIMPALVASGAADPHPDDVAINRFAAAMKARMAEMRSRGKRGWDDPKKCPLPRLFDLLKSVPPSQPVDVGNYAMMLFNRAVVENTPTPANNAAAELACPQCGADRAKVPCPGIADECAMIPDAHLKGGV